MTQLETIQKKETELFSVLVRILEENNLRYFAVYGTLLGAVRHGGFIPWDDDVDIGMPRPDYERFVSIAEKIVPRPYLLKERSVTPAYNFFFAKFVDTTVDIEPTEPDRHIGSDNPHLWIDIFPIDGMSPALEVQRRYTKRVLSLKKWYKYSILDPAFPRGRLRNAVVAVVRRFFDTERLYRKFKAEVAEYDYDASECVVFASDWTSDYSVHEKELFASWVPLDFAGLKIRAPVKYHEYLSENYGNYMELPPENQRPTHVFKLKSEKSE